MDNSRSNRVLVGLGAAAGVATIAGLLYLRAGRATCSDDSAERKALAELARRFFYVCRDVAQISKTVRAQMTPEKRESVTDEALKRQLTVQLQVLDKLRVIEAEVASQFSTSAARIEAMQQRRADCEEIRAFTDGFKTMLDDALEGKYPVLPNVHIPEQLTKQRFLEIEAEAQTLQCSRIRQEGLRGLPSDMELGEALKKIAVEAWNEILASHTAEFGASGADAFHSAMAVFLQDPEFAALRDKQELAHAKKKGKLLRTSKKS